MNEKNLLYINLKGEKSMGGNAQITIFYPALHPHSTKDFGKPASPMGILVLLAIVRCL